MIAEIGHYALVLALGMALVQGSCPCRRLEARSGADRRRRAGGVLQFLFLTIAFAALLHAYVDSDFSIQTWRQNSHSTKPMIYKISGVWGNHEGSLVLWVWILALFGGAVAVFGRNLPPSFRGRVLAFRR